MTSVAVLAANGDAPDSNSYSTAPRLKRSDCPSTSSPRACSGDMYCGVPMSMPLTVCPGIAVADVTSASAGLARRAMPKSSNLTSPSCRIITLSGLRSRWTMPARWASASADATWMPMSTTVATSSGALRAMSRSVLPSTNSQAMKCVPAASPMSWIVMMFGWFSADAALASRMNRARLSWSSADVAGRTFSATRRPRRTS